MRLPDNWRKARVTVGIALVTAAAWLLLALLRLDQWAAIGGGFIPARLAYGGDAGMVPFWLTPLTAALIHLAFVHLAFNLLLLLLCGRTVEAVLGPAGIAILYLAGAYVAAGAFYAVDPLAVSPMVGASGAVSAVIGAYAILFGRNKVKIAGPRLALWLNALWLMAACVALQVMLGVGLAGLDGILVAATGSIAGFLAGLLLANPLLLFRYRKA
ncbi:MAG TPA: rhomboid family intramembrane serine protease [Allosphingosinicella sp.]|nr:rhomboid family intramembrane serine protease [Allosphingosinicella sp.]